MEEQKEKGIEQTSNNICFVIMPFGKTTKAHNERYWTEHFDKFLKPILDEAVAPLLKVKRSEPARGDLITQIVMNLATSPIVVADLTDSNVNVYWELGVRQSFKHGTVTIAQKGTKIPFDIISKGTLFYDPTNHIQMQDFTKKLQQVVQECITNNKDSDSHVLDILGGRGSLIQFFQKDEALRRLDALLSECNSNIATIKEAIQMAKENKSIRESKENTNNKPKTPVARLRNSAIALLVTHRYLENNDAFYKKVESYYDKVLAFIAQENAWETHQSSTENWIIKTAADFEKTFVEFKTIIENNKKALTKKLI